MDIKVNDKSWLMTALLACGLLFFVAGDADAWHGGYGHAGWGHGYHNSGGWGHGYHGGGQGYYHGGYYGGGWGYGGGTQVYIGPGVGLGYYGGAPCRWVAAHRNLNGHWVRAHRACW